MILLVLETRGRKPKIYPQKEIDNIIYRFTQEEKVSGWIKYSEVYRFAKALYDRREIAYKLSEDYWRREGRQGKESIDKANKVYEATLISKKTSKSDTYVDTEECVEKFFSGKPSDKKRLIEALKMNEKKAKDYIKSLEKMDALKAEIETLKKKNSALDDSLKQYETILFSWLYASVKPDVPLMNLLTTGKSRTPIIDYFFNTAFSNPAEGFSKFEEFRKGVNKNLDSLKDETTKNVIPIRKSRLQQEIERFNPKD